MRAITEMNPYHKPAGTHKPMVDPPAVHTLTRDERFELMFKRVKQLWTPDAEQVPAKPAKK